MRTVKYMGHVDTAMMKPHITDDAISYVEVDIHNPSYACMIPSCGLIWDRMHHAESCESRGHVSTWWQGYGGYVINGVYKPANSYPRTAIGQLTPAVLERYWTTEPEGYGEYCDSLITERKKRDEIQRKGGQQ